MSEIAESLAAQGREPVAIQDGVAFSGDDILSLAADIEGRLPQSARRLLTLDSAPATLLALLAIAERRPLQLILGRPSVSLDALGEAIRADATLHAPDRIAATGDTESTDAAPGILLLTSGTTGTPKVAHQTLPALLGRVKTSALEKNRGARWLLTYESHSFAGLQVVLSAAASRGTLVAPSDRGQASLIAAVRAHGVTHVSGTPTFWRALLLMMDAGGLPSLRQITLGGEAVDQAVLDRLSVAFPAARISHIYASTEAGSLFAVHDGIAGFPGAWLTEELPGGVRLRAREGMLEVWSPRRMRGYVTGQSTPLTDDGWLITGDLIEIDGGRARFRGRADQIVNVGGLKVSPEEVEAFLLAQPAVAEAGVYAIPNPITGSLLAAKVVLRAGADAQEALKEIRAACTKNLPPHKIPRRFEVTDAIATASSGKKAKLA